MMFHIFYSLPFLLFGFSLFDYWQHCFAYLPRFPIIDEVTSYFMPYRSKLQNSNLFHLNNLLFKDVSQLTSETRKRYFNKLSETGSLLEIYSDGTN
uniref:Putative secreted protein n=1 Tax=Ixodes ricinus TaxID=34613 RepID=A0A6B0U485_IXORI